MDRWNHQRLVSASRGRRCNTKLARRTSDWWRQHSEGHGSPVYWAGTRWRRHLLRLAHFAESSWSKVWPGRAGDGSDRSSHALSFVTGARHPCGTHVPTSQIPMKLLQRSHSSSFTNPIQFRAPATSTRFPHHLSDSAERQRRHEGAPHLTQSTGIECRSACSKPVCTFRRGAHWAASY